jgi:hypothetical protein
VGGDPTLLGIAACISALGGVLTTIWAHRKSKKEEQEECHKRLRETREESEALAEELHSLKMSRFQ